MQLFIVLDWCNSKLSHVHVSFTFGSALSGIATLLIWYSTCLNIMSGLLASSLRNDQGDQSLNPSFGPPLLHGVFILFFVLFFLLHGFSPATLISSIHEHVRLIFSQYPWLRHCLKVWMESLGDAQWLSTVPQWLVRGRGHWCAGSLCQANWKHCPLIGLICENRLICSSSDGVDPFTMPLVLICLCVRAVSHEKNLPVRAFTHSLPGSVSYQTLLWAITVNHYKTWGW